MGLKLDRGQMQELARHLCRAYPEEGCGVLVGREAGGTRVVEEIATVENASPAPRGHRYSIAPEQFLDIERRARAAAREVLGFVHSHPDAEARPSAFDLEHAWDYYSYLIVCVSQGAVADTRAWRLRADRSGFDPEPVEISDPARPDAG
jgi:proteasome lid subunit RPN8/RPN11